MVQDLEQDLETVLEAYERMINATEDDRQHEAAREALADSFRFVGPQVGEVAGRAAMVETMNGLRERAPSDTIRIRRTTGIDQHNGWLRFGWEFVDADGGVLAQGMDVAHVAADGRLSLVVAFFGQLQQKDSTREVH